VRILDKNLNLLEEKRSDKAINSLKVSFPQNAKYLMIDDAVSLENIKRGLKIYLE
jgi:putative periplasmic protein